jgi:hypothetical protein
MAVIEINWSPNRRQLRTFGWVGAAALAAVGTWIFLRRSFFGAEMSDATATIAAVVLWAAAGVLFVLASAAPAALRPVYVGLTIVTFPIGIVLSYVIMAVLFFGLFTPIGLVFRLIRRDALHRAFDPDAASYWVPRDGVRDVRRYFRQF